MDSIQKWLSVEVFSQAAGISLLEGSRWYRPFVDAADQFQINTPQRLAAFIAQCGHESSNFKTLTENMNYSAKGLLATWPSRFDAVLAEKMARKPELIANYVYAGRNGNGSSESGDGWKYRGHGLIQLTGRDNYRRCGKDLGIDLEAYPDLLTIATNAARAAGWFWQSKKLNDLADKEQFKQITKRINGGLIGLDDREIRWARAKKALGIS